MNSLITPIVEGDGDVKAIPILLRRICHEILDRFDVTVRKPWRLPRGKIVKSDELGKVANVLSQTDSISGGILVVLDLDDDKCPVDLAQSIISTSTIPRRLEVVVACREYEAWFLASAESLRTHRSVIDDAAYLDDPELPRDAKGRLQNLMTEKYREVLHQPSFTSLVNLSEAAKRSRSLRHLIGATTRLIDQQ